MERNNKRITNAWAMYDWANSVYALCISTAVFPIYYSSMTNPEGIDHPMVNFLGLELPPSTLLSFIISAAYLIISFMSPILSGIADYSSNKKGFMKFFVILGSISCISLYFFIHDRLWIGLLGALLASIGFAGSLVFYNAFLPEIATPDQFDRLSAKGFSFGYIGSVLLLILILTMISFYEPLHLGSKAMATRISFVLVGIWWFGFSLITFKYVPEKRQKFEINKTMLSKGLDELIKVWQKIKRMKSLKTFLISFFFLSMGVQTVVIMAGIYSKENLGFQDEILIMIILIIQLVAVIGSLLFARLSGILGNKKTLLIQILTWFAICILAYAVTKENRWLFYVVAVMVGLVLGGIQSLARATYSKLIPPTEDHASYFSFYEVTEKLAIVLGMASFGVVTLISGGTRNSVLVLGLFFVLSFFTLYRLKEKHLSH